MPSYAQTNIQLYDQLRSQGWSQADVFCVAEAYGLAQRLFSARFRCSGKPFVAHLVGTASILAAHGNSLDTVLAGQLHAAYEQGDFGTFGRRDSKRNRRILQNTIGPAAENLVHRYTNFRLDDKYPDSSDSLPILDDNDRNVVLIRAANELEECVDLGISYCCDARRAKTLGQARMSALIVERFGYHNLATDLRHAISIVEQTSIPKELVRSFFSSYTLTPASFNARILTVVHLTAFSLAQMPWKRIHYVRKPKF